MECGGISHLFYGTVLLCLADTLAAHHLGGFKVGVGFSLRICRDCMATREQIQTKVSIFLVHIFINSSLNQYVTVELRFFKLQLSEYFN